MNRETWQATVHGVKKRAVNTTQLCMKSPRDRAHSPLRGHFSNKTRPKNQATYNQSSNQKQTKELRVTVMLKFHLFTDFPVLLASDSVFLLFLKAKSIFHCTKSIFPYQRLFFKKKTGGKCEPWLPVAGTESFLPIRA